MNPDVNGWATRLLTAAAMLVGLTAGIHLLTTGSRLGGLVLAQKTTILAVPLCALVMLLLISDRRVIPENRFSWPLTLWAVLPFLVLLAMSVYRLIESCRPPDSGSG